MVGQSGVQLPRTTNSLLCDEPNTAILERMFGESDLAPVRKSPSEVGALSELAVSTALLHAGLAVYLPFFSAHSRVDLIYLTADGAVRRVQCKTARLHDGVVSFATCSNTGGTRKTYEHDVDEFAAYCADNDTVYLVPVAEAPTREARLRIEPPRSNQSIGIRWAEPYRLKPKSAPPSP